MKTTIEGVDFDELGLYLSWNLESNELERLETKDVCPLRISKRRKPEITTNGMKTRKSDRSRIEAEVMFKEALRIALMLIMKNHTYEFNGEIRRQARGGPIGLDLTGTVAKIYMKWWDGQLKGRLADIGILLKLYERYVDDIVIAMKAIAEGARYRDGEIWITEETREMDRVVPRDKRTFEFVRAVANTIHPSIQVKVDVPSDHEDQKLPALDLKVWIDEVAVGDSFKRKIIHEHYVKDIASKYVIEEQSAMPIHKKRQILTQMCLRVLLNNSQYLDMESKKRTVGFFLNRMQASGYKQQFRYQVLKSALKAYETISNDTTRTLYRGKEMNTPERRVEVRDKKRKWYKKGNSESVLFVQATKELGVGKECARSHLGKQHQHQSDREGRNESEENASKKQSIQGRRMQ